MMTEMDDLFYLRQEKFDFTTYCNGRFLIEEVVARGAWTKEEIETIVGYITTTTPITSMHLWARLQSNVNLLMACHPHVSTFMVNVALNYTGPANHLPEDEYKEKISGPRDRIYQEYLSRK